MDLGPSGHDKPYLDLILQIQTHGSAALAQVLALDEQLLKHLHDPASDERVPAVLAEGATRLVLLPDFAQILREGASLTQAISRLLAAEDSQLGLDQAFGPHVSDEIGQWIKWACDIARCQGQGVRLGG